MTARAGGPVLPEAGNTHARHTLAPVFLAPREYVRSKAALAEHAQAKLIRRALGLTQQEFAARYHIPLGTLRDWEQGRAKPDAPTQAYLTVIARSPIQVREALEG